MSAGKQRKPARRQTRRTLEEFADQKEHEVAHSPAVATAAFEARAATRRLQSRIRFLEGELEEAAHQVNLNALLKELAKEAAPSLPPPKPAWQAPSGGEGEVVETMVQMLSDWHAFEEVKASRTRGFASYSPEIMTARVANMVAAHTFIKRKMERGGWRFPEIFIPLLGDFIPGTIHNLERHANGLTIVASTFNAAWLLAQVLRDLKAEYERMYVCGVVGNHGRLPDDRKVPSKDPTRNWDYMVYLLAAEMLRDCEGIEFRFPDAYSAQVNIRGYNVLLNHGDKIRRWMGIPWYGIERWDVKSTALEAQRANVIHYRLLGQFHKSAQLPSQVGEKFVNGSVVGANEYAVDEVTESDPPKQLMFGMHAQFGATHRWPLLLTVDRPGRPNYNLARLRELQSMDESDENVARVWSLPRGEKKK